VAHAGSMGAVAIKAGSIATLEEELVKAKDATRPVVIVIDTDPMPSTHDGGSWWEVGVPEVSVRPAVNKARAAYVENKQKQRVAD
jgi:3D-(3,5/4)-trihydroxycyclohexane-1,2-dione acylhydrolase (decyclizing)